MNIRLHLDRDLCVRCGVCVASCPTDVIRPGPAGPDDAPVVAYPEDCQACFLCVFDCTVEAISLTQDALPYEELATDPVLSGPPVPPRP